MQSLSKKLRAAGWIHTYDWTIHGTVKETDMKTLKEVGKKELDAVREADILIVLTPQGRGTHTELGIAAALDKKIYLCHTDNHYFLCDDNTSAFYWLPNVKHVIGNTDEIAKEVLLENSTL